MSRKSTGMFQQQELRERVRRLEREIAALKAATEKDRAVQTTRQATGETSLPKTVGVSKPKSS